MSSTIQLETLLRERHQQRMLSIVTASNLPYKREVDYRGFNEAIRVTLVSYHYRCFGLVGPQPTSENVLHAPNPRW